MAETVSMPDLQSYADGKDYVPYTVEGMYSFVLFLRADPENTRGGEVNGEPYVQPSLFSHLLKSLKPGTPNKRV